MTYVRVAFIATAAAALIAVAAPASAEIVGTPDGQYYRLGACPSSGGIFGTNLIPFAA